MKHMVASCLLRRCKSHWPLLLTAISCIAVLATVSSVLHKSSDRRHSIYPDFLRLRTVEQQSRSRPARVLHPSATCPACRLPLNNTTSKATLVSQQTLPDTELYISWLNTGSIRRNDSFDPQINSTELRAMLNLFWSFLDLCEQHGIQAMLYGGTLLGSYRHHGFMPWDDDVDLLLKESDQGALEAAVKRTYPDLEITKAGRWKVWNKTICFNQAYSWCWPYLDLSFYALSGDKIWDTVAAYGYNYSYPLQFTFPLHKRPFMGRWVHAPRDTLRFLGYDKSPTEDCVSLYYSHKLEGSPVSEVMTVNCASLAATYPFVIRVPNVAGNGDGILETLRLYGAPPAYTVPVDEPKGSFNLDYTIVPIG